MNKNDETADEAVEQTDEGLATEDTEVGDDTPTEATSEADKAQEYLESLQRLQAEFDNYRKRVISEQVGIATRANASLIEKLLPLLDSFERAVFVAEKTKDAEGLIKGTEMVYAEFLATLEKEGLEEIKADDLPFDPSVHEAVMEVESADHESGHVVDVLRKGYRVGDRMIRASMVKVST